MKKDRVYSDYTDNHFVIRHAGITTATEVRAGGREECTILQRDLAYEAAVSFAHLSAVPLCPLGGDADEEPPP
jgi:hypothetical protein